MTIRVGVLRGGLSREHEVSLRTGKNILSNLPQKYSGHDILLTKKGEWIFNNQFSYPEKIFRSVDVVFNALHGYFGEDGKIQQILEHFNVPYTGSGVFASALGMNKILSRDIFARAGLNVPQGTAIDKDSDIIEVSNKIFKTFSPPWVVKPASCGSSIGVYIIHNFYNLPGAIEQALNFSDKAIVEEYIRGKEAACGVIENFRGQEHYSLPVTEIISSRQICPARFDRDLKNKIEEMAKIAHRLLGCRHYSRQDFRISERAGDRGKIYILEANTLPGLTTESLVPKAVEAVGSSYSDFLGHVINLALI